MDLLGSHSCKSSKVSGVLISLKSGMNNYEIKEILNGSKDDIPDNELVAVLFGEHYASSHEMPDKAVVERLIQEYGREGGTSVGASC